MFGLTGTLNYYLCDGFTDMRCGIDGLSKLVRTKMRQDPTNGDVFFSLLSLKPLYFKMIHDPLSNILFYF